MMIPINIDKYSEYPDDLILAKRNIENYLISNKKLTEHMKIKDFFMWLNLSAIYNENNSTIAFKVIKTITDIYVFYSITNYSQEIEKSFFDKLKSINYNISNLSKRTMLEIIQNNLGQQPYFMINSEFYT